MTAENDIFERLKPLLVEVLGVAPEKLRPESVLVADLGAESIDLLDLSFLIEETFGITIEADEFESRASEQIPGGQYERNGNLTPEAIEELKKALPEVPIERFRSGLKKIEIPSILNVAVFVHLIQRKVALKQREVVDA